MDEEKTIHELFDAGLIFKTLHALTEIVGGVFTYLISPNFVFDIVKRITQGELAEDPTDSFTRYILGLAHSFSVDTKQFIAFYLLSHGIVNLVLVIGLFKKKIWAYYLSFVTLTAFAIYQTYRYIYNPSLWLIAFTLFDFVFIWLIWREYKVISK